jgi:outer membrane protein assembly factor BamE (lipoprotein component of BamABCDE complex)
MTTLRNLAILATVALLAGCASPQTRIADNRALYDSLPAESQALIQEGRVAVGFTADMVRLSLGEPDRVYSRTDGSGKSESWAYTSYRLGNGNRIYSGYYHSWYPHRYPYFLDYIGDDREVYERTKIVFKNGVVDSIEEVSS